MPTAPPTTPGAADWRQHGGPNADVKESMPTQRSNPRIAAKLQVTKALSLSCVPCGVSVHFWQPSLTGSHLASQEA